MADLDSRHQAAELATTLRSVLATIGQNGADHVFAVEKAQEALARYRPDGPDLTLELQSAAALILYRLNEVPRHTVHQALAEAARNLRAKLTKLGERVLTMASGRIAV